MLIVINVCVIIEILTWDFVRRISGHQALVKYLKGIINVRIWLATVHQ